MTLLYYLKICDILKQKLAKDKILMTIIYLEFISKEKSA